MKLWIAIVVMMFATVGHAGKAEAGSYYTGSQVLEWCETGGTAGESICNGYLAGVHDITGTYDTLGDMNKEFCIPNNVGTVQLRKVAIKGLNERPEDLHMSASSLVLRVFYKAWPCD